MKNYFLLEVGVEELPSRFVESTLTQIKENLEKSLKENRVEFKDFSKFSFICVSVDSTNLDGNSSTPTSSKK